MAREMVSPRVSPLCHECDAMPGNPQPVRVRTLLGAFQYKPTDQFLKCYDVN